MAELSPEFVTTANRMGVPLPPRHRPRFLSRWFRIDWTGALTAPPHPFADFRRSIANFSAIDASLPMLVAGFDEDGSPIFTDP